MTPFGFLGGFHLTSMRADPKALRIGELRSSGAASYVLVNTPLLTPQLPWKNEKGCLVIFIKQANHICLSKIHMHIDGRNQKVILLTFVCVTVY